MIKKANKEQKEKSFYDLAHRLSSSFVPKVEKDRLKLFKIGNNFVFLVLLVLVSGSFTKTRGALCCFST